MKAEKRTDEEVILKSGSTVYVVLQKSEVFGVYSTRKKSDEGMKAALLQDQSAGATVFEVQLDATADKTQA